MQMIIDIPDNEYKQNKHYYDSVYQGIPLENVFVTKILDDIGNIESEDNDDRSGR